MVLLLFVAGCASESESSIERGVKWLESQQHPDGSWRSGTHGVFRDGSALTPHVLRTLVEAGGDAAAIARGCAFLEAFDDRRLAYPTYAAADASRVLRPAKWLAVLRSRQLVDRESFPSTGGWAYPGGAIDPTVEANLSATAYAVCALADAGTPPGDPAIAAGLAFVLRCRDEDGGFRFGATDTVDNKAGVGIAYGTTTADGLRAMLACGLRRDDPRVKQTAKWLLDRFDPANVSGDFTAAREPMRNANYFYYTAALSDAFTRAGVPSRQWAGAIAIELMNRQLDAGSWKNDLSAGREDDAIVATALAVQAMARCP